MPPYQLYLHYSNYQGSLRYGFAGARRPRRVMGQRDVFEFSLEKTPVQACDEIKAWLKLEQFPQTGTLSGIDPFDDAAGSLSCRVEELGAACA